MRFVLFAATAFVTTVLAVSGAAKAADPPDPQAIFAAARKAWDFTSYPRYANYTVGVTYTNGSDHIERHYDTLEDLRRNIVFAHTFSHEEAANPNLPPSGVNVGVLGVTVNKSQADDPIGPVALAITYDFGIALVSRPTQVEQLGSQVTSPKGYVVIGQTGTAVKTYSVRLLGTLDNAMTYHLGLTPLKDPQRFRLREMWVDAKTYLTKKILISANFSKKPYTDVTWLIRFKQFEGGPYIVSERAQGALDFGDAGSLQDVTITFTDFKKSTDLPAYGTVGINGGETVFVREP